MRDSRGRFRKGSQVGKNTQFRKGVKSWLKRNPNNPNLLNSLFKKGHKTNVGRLVKKETRDKIRKNQVGEKGHNWLGGSSFQGHGKGFNNELKKSIRKKFNYCCFECGLHEKDCRYKHAVHHINYKKGDNSESNLVLLCTSCHSKTGFKRKNWKNYFEERLR